MAAEKSTVILLSLDKAEIFDTRYDALLRGIRDQGGVIREVRTAEQFDEHRTDPDLLGVIVTDATIIDSISKAEKAITDALITLARDNGVTVIYGCDCPRRIYSLVPPPEARDDDTSDLFTLDPESHMVLDTDTDKYMIQNWGLPWGFDEYPDADYPCKISKLSSLYEILNKNTDVRGEHDMHILPIRYIEYQCHRVIGFLECCDTSPAAFASFGKGYVGMAGELDGSDEMVPIYIAMLGFWGREGVKEKEARKVVVSDYQSD